jgi:hypothetical protein
MGVGDGLGHPLLAGLDPAQELAVTVEGVGRVQVGRQFVVGAPLPW